MLCARAHYKLYYTFSVEKTARENGVFSCVALLTDKFSKQWFSCFLVFQHFNLFPNIAAVKTLCRSSLYMVAIET